jgi:hypothetical protein
LLLAAAGLWTAGTMGAVALLIAFIARVRDDRSDDQQ